MKYPASIGDDPLLYHRLTGLRGSRTLLAQHLEQGFVLQPFDERGEDATMFGVDPIDLVAGDGGCVFMTPQHPVRETIGGRFARSPGVAFRLSDLAKLTKVTARPCDLQTFYIRIAVESSDPARRAHDRFMRQVEDIYERASALEPFSDLFHLVRDRIEVSSPAEVLRACQGESLHSLTRLKKGEVVAAAAQAANFVFDFLEDEVEEDESLLDVAKDGFREAATDSVHEGWTNWLMADTNQRELCVWGSVPLSLAVLVFDGNGYEPLPRAGGALGGVRAPRVIPAVSAGNRPGL